MFETYRSRKSFENCGVRATVDMPRHRKWGKMICAKNPEGFRVSESDFKYKTARDDLSMTLGCLACPYRKMDLPTDDLAAEAIVNISTRGAANELESLIIARPELGNTPPTPEQ